MVSGPFPISARDIMAPGPVSASENGSSLVPKEVKGEPASENVDLPALTEAVQEKISMIHNVDLRFSVHEGSGRTVVTVMDSLTGEVIREIPPSEILNLAARLDEMIGLLFDQLG